MKNDDLGDRMKGYESLQSQKLISKVPVIIRCDGKAFSTLTKGMEKPWDSRFVSAMQQTCKYLCKNIQGAQFGYVQSDEISILLLDYKKYATSLYFDGKIQKMCSIIASMASVHFSQTLGKTGLFDCRAFSIPEHDVRNCFLWRQKDCIRNSIQSLARANFSPRELMNKSCRTLKEMLNHKGISWDEIETHLKVGTACVRHSGDWQLDLEMPSLLNQPKYIHIPQMHWGEENDI